MGSCGRRFLILIFEPIKPMSELPPLRASVIYRPFENGLNPSFDDYEEAIEALRDAQGQLMPDGRNCAVCTDSGHQAWECHHNPLVVARANSRDAWRCFHCGRIFRTPEAALEHFGKPEEQRDPVCSAVFVDALFTMEAQGVQARKVGARNGHRWCHMWSDSLEALHRMAARIGMKREWFQDHHLLPHYDLTPSRRALAVSYGAIEASASDAIRERSVRSYGDPFPLV